MRTKKRLPPGRGMNGEKPATRPARPARPREVLAGGQYGQNEAAAILGVDRARLRRAREAGTLRALPMAGVRWVRYAGGELLRWRDAGMPAGPG